MGEVRGSPAPPWSDLPLELLVLVFLRLPTRVGRAFFPAVCRMWCFAARQCRLPPPSLVPWLLCPDGSATSFPRGETFQLPDGMRYHNSFGEWVLMSCNDGSCLLMNHFTKATMTLPSLSSYTYYQEPVEVLNNYSIPHPKLGPWLRKYKGEISVASLVVCSTRLIAAIVAIGSVGTIGLCRPGAAAWSVSAHQGCGCLLDMVFMEGKIYTIDRTAGLDLIAIDIVDEYDNEPRVSRIKYLIGGFPSQSIRQGRFTSVPYILESHGALLMACKILSYKIEHESEILVAGVSKFEVFEADLERHLWNEIRTLGNDRALFLARGCSRSVRVSPYDLSRDCIFFLDDSINRFSNSKKVATSCELYDMKDEKIYSPLPMVSWKSEKVLATWIFSQGETDKASVSRSQEIVEPEVKPLMLICGGSCSAVASTTPH